MKIKTLVPVTFNSGIASQQTSKVEGEISLVRQDYLRDSYNFMFTYKTEAGEQIQTPSSDFSLTKDEINAFYDVVKAGVPTDMEYFETTEYVYYLGFKIEMANTFGIEPSDIEIIL
jgi:hypothetical protein